mmetsp:Transcript_27510/g.46501  ORF Transcript_27510/g.46501 Transcript_27510/m.46501 type:complete len:214 (-) Transcript_27510:300-941(-)
MKGHPPHNRAHRSQLLHLRVIGVVLFGIHMPRQWRAFQSRIEELFRHDNDHIQLFLHSDGVTVRKTVRNNMIRGSGDVISLLGIYPSFFRVALSKVIRLLHVEIFITSTEHSRFRLQCIFARTTDIFKDWTLVANFLQYHLQNTSRQHSEYDNQSACNGNKLHSDGRRIQATTTGCTPRTLTLVEVSGRQRQTFTLSVQLFAFIIIGEKYSKI